MHPVPRILATIVTGLGLAMAFADHGMAAVSEKDVLIIGRVIALIDHGPTGTVPIIIVQGGDATSTDIADMLNVIGEGKTVGALTLSAHPVRYDALAANPALVVFIPAGLSASELDAVFAIAKARKLVTISTASACLSAQKCAIAITSEPAVDIRVSIAAAAATNVHFGSTFRMMIKEVQ